MTGVEKRQGSVLRIEFGVEERDEPVGRDAIDQIAIDCADSFHQRVVDVGLRVHGGVHA